MFRTSRNLKSWKWWLEMIGWIIIGILYIIYNLVVMFRAYRNYKIKKYLEKIKIGTLLDCIHTAGFFLNEGKFVGIVIEKQFKQFNNQTHDFKITLYDINTNIFYDLFGNLITNSVYGISYDAIEHSKKDLVWYKNSRRLYHRIYINGVLE